MPSLVRRLAVLGALVIIGAPAAAQAQSYGTYDPIGADPSQVVSLNPLAIILGGFSAEYEVATTSNTSAAIAVSIWDASKYDSAIDAKFRIYPSGRALEGFAVGLSGGYTRVHGCADFSFGDCDTDGGADDALALGVEVNYQWVLGPERNFAVTLGAGAKRRFYTAGRSGSDAAGTGRFSVGYAF